MLDGPGFGNLEEEEEDEEEDDDDDEEEGKEGIIMTESVWHA